MATVALDCSEYDMLRENKKSAERKVNDLLKEIEEAKRLNRVIITTKYCALGFDKELFIRTFLSSFRCSNGVSITNSLNEAIRVGTGILKDSRDSSDIVQSSSQLINFDDVRIQVENRFREQYELEIRNKKLELEESKRRYDEKYSKLNEVYAEKHIKELKEQKDSYENTIESLKCAIQEIKEINKELSKTTEQQIVEAKLVIKEQEEKLKKLQRRKFWFNN